jgi:hypothetical protein
LAYLCHDTAAGQVSTAAMAGLPALGMFAVVCCGGVRLLLWRRRERKRIHDSHRSLSGIKVGGRAAGGLPGPRGGVWCCGVGLDLVV